MTRITALALLIAAATLAPRPAAADYIDHLATTEDVGWAKVPAFGDARILVIPVEVEGHGALDMERMRRFFAAETTGEFAFTDYWTRASLGAYRPQATVVDPVRFESCPLPEDYFGYEDCAIPRGGGASVDQIIESLEGGLAMVEAILDQVDAQGVDFTGFDVNGPIEGTPDGWIDGVLIVHNIDFGGIALPLYWLKEQFLGEPPLSYDGIQINIVGIAEDEAVAVHEFGHLLGWADLYDESGRSKGYQYSVMGSWDYEEPVHGVDAFSRVQIGWTAPMAVYDVGDEVKDVRLRPAMDSGDAVQIGVGEEYYLVEARGPVQGDYVDAGLLASGLSITHVNLRKAPPATEGQWTLRLLNCLNCDTWAPLVMNEQADGLFELQLPGSRRDDRGDIFQPGTRFVPSLVSNAPLGEDHKVLSSNRYDGAVTGIAITNIRADGEDVLFDLTVYEPCALLACSNGGVCEDGRCLSGFPSPAGGVAPWDDNGGATGDPDAGSGAADTGAGGGSDVGGEAMEDGGGSDGGCGVAPGRAGGLVGAWALLAALVAVRRR